MMCLVLAGLEMTAGFVPAAYASGPGGNVADPVVKAVDIAKPAVVRIITLVVGQLTVTINGANVTFPLAPQQGFNGYPLQLSGTGAFISAHGDLLTADHVVNPVQDDKPTMDQFLDQTAAPDIASYINQKGQQQVTADQVTQELLAGQLQSTQVYQKAQSQVFRSTDYSGPLSATSFQQLPQSQFADVDQIKKSSPASIFDTAIIHVNGMDNMPMLQLGDSSTVQSLDQLTIIGFPGDSDVNNSPNGILTSSVNPIQVSSIKTLDNGAPLIQVSGNVTHGDSGGPALDSNGHIVGVVSFGTTAGSTSFLRASNTAKQMIQQAGIDTTPSAFQKAWNQAFNDYASTAPGHWHLAMSEFQQLSSQYPQFKALSPFLQYATQQARSETSTPANTAHNPVASGSGGLNPVLLLIGGIVLLVIVVFGWSMIATRKRKSSLPGVAVTPPAVGYGTMPAAPYFNTPGQSYGALPANAPGPAQPQVGQFPPAPVPQTPFYPPQAAQSQIRPSAPQPAYRPQAPSPAPQPAYRSQPPAQPGGMAAFGAPSMPGSLPVTPQAAVPSASQWRIWPCGHTNRFDASFCGTCGDPSPPAPIVRRLEQ